MESIAAIARKLGVEPKHLVPYGEDKAKVSLDAIRPGAPHGKLIAVTGITPTPAVDPGPEESVTCNQHHILRYECVSV